MPLPFPTQGTLHDVFHPAIPYGWQVDSLKRAPAQAPKRTPLQARSELYTAWSVVDDAKNKANALSAEATKEFEKAAGKAQPKAKHIEMYSGNFYAACITGGLLACVGAPHCHLTHLTCDSSTQLIFIRASLIPLLHLLILSNVADKSTQSYIPQTFKPGARSSGRKASGASTPDGAQPFSDTLLKAPSSTEVMSSSRSITLISLERKMPQSIRHPSTWPPALLLSSLPILHSAPLRP